MLINVAKANGIFLAFFLFSISLKAHLKVI